jgi:Flp pilus assembly protein TadG
VREDRGQSLVEFALMVPILFLLIVGLVDIGQGLQAYVALGNAVRETARETAVHGAAASTPWGPAANDANVTTSLRSRAVGLDGSAITVTSSWPSGSNAQGNEAVITATYTFQPAASALIGGVTLPLSAQTRVRIQN